MAVTKIYSFSGNIKNGEIKEFVPESNFKLNYGNWQISIDNCHINIKEKIPKAIIVGISTNLLSQVKSEQVTIYSENKRRKKEQLLSKQAIIGTFLIPKSTIKKHCVLDSCMRPFINIDGKGNEVIFFFTDLCKNKPLTINCDVFLTLYFQRVQ